MAGTLVHDEEYTNAISTVSTTLKDLSDACEQFVNELKRISDDGIVMSKLAIF